MSTERWDSVLFRNKNTYSALIGCGYFNIGVLQDRHAQRFTDFWRTGECIFNISSGLWGTLTFGWFRNISTAWLTSASSLFLDPLKIPQSRMMDEVIKLEGESRMKAEESISGKLSASCNSQTIWFQATCL